MTKRTTKQAVKDTFEANRTEALRRLRLLTDAVTAAGRDTTLDWGDVGSMDQVVKKLGQAGHWAGIEELTEK